MIDLISRQWWVFSLRGALAILFGIAAFVFPGAALTAIVLVFGAYALTDGVLAVVSSFTTRGSNPRWWLLLLEGVAGVFAGLYAILYTGMAALSLLYLAAAWAIVTGVFQIMTAIRWPRAIHGEWLLAFAGIASIVLGVVLFAEPVAGLLVWAWTAGAYALVFGVLMLSLGFRLRRLRARERKGSVTNQKRSVA